MPIPSRLSALLLSRHLPFLLMVPAVLLALPSLGIGLSVDDYVVRAAVRGTNPGPGGVTPFDAFRFADEASSPRLVADGVLPWWTAPGLKLAFFRPLSSLSHWLDFRLFPGSPMAMHAVSLAWLAATVVVATLLYRRLIGEGWVAGMAATFFAFDPGHTLAAGWVSARNAVLATFFGLAALYLHDRGRREGARWATWAAPLFTALSLATGEAGVGTLALLGAHALAFEGPGLAARARALAPHVVVALVWAVVYKAHGCGTAHSAMYLDPFSAPGDFLRYAALTLPLNVGAKLGGLPASLVVLTAARVWPMLAAVGLLFVVFAVAAIRPLLRREPAARFFLAGAVLAALPIAGTLPNDRSLMLVGFAGLGLEALIVQRAIGGLWGRPAPTMEKRGRLLRLYAGWILLFDLVIAIPGGLANSVSIDALTRFSREPLSRVLLDDAVRGQTVVFVNPPAQFLISHLGVMREGTGLPIPERMRGLVPGIYGSRVVRPREDQLAVHVEGGILPPPGTWPATAGEGPASKFEYTGQHLGSYARGARDPMHAGDVISLPGLRIEVTAVAGDGGPSDMIFTFDRSLDDPSLRWLAWRDGGYVPFTVPRVGQAVELDPTPMDPTVDRGSAKREAPPR